MTVRQTFGQVGRSNPDPSMAELLFRSWVRGEIAQDDYLVGSANWVADNLNQYSARRYPPLPAPLLAYVLARVSGQRDRRDEDMHRKVGMWAQAVGSLLEQNSADHSLLMWALEKCHAKNLRAQVSKIERKLPEFAIPIPDAMSASLECLARDAEDKLREVRRRA